MPSTLKAYVTNPLLIINSLGVRGFLRWLPDSLYLKMIFRARMGYPLNLKNPRTFNEKLNWLKLYGNPQQYANLVDKYEVRQYISETIGEEYLIPLIGVWDKFEDIDFSKLPEQFALKCTHDSGSVVICTNKNAFDFNSVKRKLKKCLKQRMDYKRIEPQYKNVRRRIICEQYMVDESGTELRDYKVYCFNGKPKFIQVIFGRFTGSKCNLYDIEWSYIPVARAFPTDPGVVISKPSRLEKMLDLAKILSGDYPFVRVDFYSIGDRVYFGELTFTPASGFGKFDPEEFDLEAGSWLELPKLKE